MSRGSWTKLAALAALWGASYMLIKVSLNGGVGPFAIVFARTALAALVLIPVAKQLGALEGLRGRFGWIALLALVQVAAPFVLITAGEREIPSSLAGMLIATAPIFTFLMAFTLEGAERAGATSLAGVVIGIVGVTVVLGVETGGAVVGGLMVVLAAVGYAVGAWYLKRGFSDLQPMGVLAANMTATALMTLPFAAFDLPTEAPPLDAIAAILSLGVLGTGVAFMLFYSLITREGPARASLVGYLATGFAVFYGVLVLDESFTLTTAAGLVLILAGSWLAAGGRLPLRRRASAAASGQLAAGGVDVAPASKAHGRP
jgi:drug/metabolite transporter (DMT)-like permease